MPTYRVEMNLILDVEMTDEVARRAQDQTFVDMFYGLDTPEKIAEHLAWNLGVRNHQLDDLDGFADLSADGASAVIVDCDYATRLVEEVA